MIGGASSRPGAESADAVRTGTEGADAELSGAEMAEAPLGMPQITHRDDL